MHILCLSYEIPMELHRWVCPSLTVLPAADTKHVDLQCLSVTNEPRTD
jgi:hypothetical protein